MQKVLAIIPARAGSKSVKDKNIRLCNGKPLLTYSIDHAKESKYINRIIVSTDSELYAQIALEAGAEVPFKRPSSISGDFSLDLEVFQHALNFLKREEKYEPDIVVQLRPTYPIRNVEDIDNMIEMLMKEDQLDSVRCVAPAKETPYKMWYKTEGNLLKPILHDIKEAYNMPRQELPKVYYQNACVDVIRPRVIINQNSMTGNNIAGYEMKHNFDIDTEEEFLRAEQWLKLKSKKSRFVVDIDGVIAQFREDLNYESALPNKKMIDVLNELYRDGNEIILFTARGYVTKKNWRELTEKQLLNWGLKYDELHFGKPNADFYIDDKMLSINDLYSIIGTGEN